MCSMPNYPRKYYYRSFYVNTLATIDINYFYFMVDLFPFIAERRRQHPSSNPKHFKQQDDKPQASNQFHPRPQDTGVERVWRVEVTELHNDRQYNKKCKI